MSGVKTGYLGLFRPPYVEEFNKASIYCMSPQYNDFLIAIPLTNSFMNDLVNEVKNHKARIIYIVAIDIGPFMLSDVYNSYNYITKVLHKTCHVVSNLPIDMKVPEDFSASVIVPNNCQLTIPYRSGIGAYGNVTIEFTLHHCNPANIYPFDIIIKDGFTNRLLAHEMNSEKAEFYNTCMPEIDEIHMNYIEGLYGGLGYNDTLKLYPSLVPRLYCNLFGTTEEYLYAMRKGIKLGGVY